MQFKIVVQHLRKKKKQIVIELLKNRNYDIIDNDNEFKYLRSMTFEQLEEENIEINLTKQEIIFGNKQIKFDIDSFKKKCLLDGLDDIALSLEKSEKISFYEEKINKNKPWIN